MFFWESEFLEDVTVIEGVMSRAAGDELPS